MEDDLLLASDLIRNEIQAQLSKLMKVKSYNGVDKPTSGKYNPTISNKINTGGLYDSVQVYPTIDYSKGVLTLTIQMSDYWTYVDKGRRPGTEFDKQVQRRKKDGSFGDPYYIKSYNNYPNIAAIREWVQTKPALSFPQLSIEQRTYLAARSIARDGIEPTNFVQKGIQASLDQIAIYISQDLADKIEEMFNADRIVFR